MERIRHTHFTIGSLLCVLAIVGFFGSQLKPTSAIDCTGKPYGTTGCPTRGTVSETGKAPPHCGDGILEEDEGEECDLGFNRNGKSNCTEKCQLLFCGDGILSPSVGEECDDPDVEEVYGPRDQETGEYTIIRRYSTPTCGRACTVPSCIRAPNGDVTCSGGCEWQFLPACPVAGTQPAASSAIAAANAASSAPTLHAAAPAASSAAPVAVCGNGTREGLEECDDGNRINDDACTNGCKMGICGDRIRQRELGEECDDGNRLDDDSCSNACQKPFCGDRITQRDLAEECDDGNKVNDDTCSNVCKVPRCGDGILHVENEACDAGVRNGDYGDATCRKDCTMPRCGDGVRDPSREECDDGNMDDADICTTSCRRSRCGDGIVFREEECDDGNEIDSDDCNNRCKLPRCGDGIMQPQRGEQCDDGPRNSASPNTQCRADCTPRRCGDGVRDAGEECDDGNVEDADACTSSCKRARCGDGILQSESDEQCDDGNTIDGDECSASCALPSCGDGIIQRGEQCDDGNTIDEDGCSLVCRLPACGNGVREFGEECDDGSDNSNNKPGTCRIDCRAAHCGDGVVDEGEQCDPSASGGESCTEQCVQVEMHAAAPTEPTSPVAQSSRAMKTVGAVFASMAGLLLGAGVFLRRRLVAFFTHKTAPAGGSISLDDVPLSDIEMPWRTWGN